MWISLVPFLFLHFIYYIWKYWILSEGTQTESKSGHCCSVSWQSVWKTNRQITLFCRHKSIKDLILVLWNEKEISLKYKINVVWKKMFWKKKWKIMSQVSRFAYADDLSHFAVLSVSKISRMNIYSFHNSSQNKTEYEFLSE